MSVGNLYTADAEPDTRVAVLVEYSDKHRVFGINGLTYWFTNNEFELPKENQKGALIIVEATEHRDFANDRVWKLVRE